MRRDNAISGLNPAIGSPGSALVGVLFTLFLALATPTRAEDGDARETPSNYETSDDKSSSERAQAEKAREVRPALARRKRNALNQFDPKVFEARGRELQGEYYEIASFAKAPAWSSTPAEVGASAPETSSSKNWMIWSGAAGLAVIVGGATGWLMIDKQTESPPVSVQLDDKP